MFGLICFLTIFASSSCIYGFPNAYYNPDPYATPPPWRGPIHIPILRPDGVPREPSEVEASRQHHLAKLSEAYATAAPKVGLQNSAYNPSPQSQWNNPPQNHWNPPQQNHWQNGNYRGPLPEFGPNGVVKETREYEAIRNQHLQEYNRALSRAAPYPHH